MADDLRRQRAAEQLRAYQGLGLSVTALAGYRRLLTMAAGVSEATYRLLPHEDREAALTRGRAVLIRAAGYSTARWKTLPPYSQARADVLLAGAHALAMRTDWAGWGSAGERVSG